EQRVGVQTRASECRGELRVAAPRAVLAHARFAHRDAVAREPGAQDAVARVLRIVSAEQADVAHRPPARGAFAGRAHSSAYLRNTGAPASAHSTSPCAPSSAPSWNTYMRRKRSGGRSSTSSTDARRPRARAPAAPAAA